jgi:uncharacterized protein (DUF2236 family)
MVVLLGWGRAILLQFAHPLVAAGVADYSEFRTGLYSYVMRARRTVEAMLAMTFGTDDANRAMASQINATHDRVHGRLREPAGVFPAGTPYSARDPRLLRWVHATMLDSVPLAYRLFAGPLTPDEADRYCAEASTIAPLLHIRDRLLPRSCAELDCYMKAMYDSGEIYVTPTARLLARSLLAPPIGLATPLLAPIRLTTIGLLPPAIRQGYGFEWHAKDERALRRWVTVLRRLRSLLPPLLREWPAVRMGCSALMSRQ